MPKRCLDFARILGMTLVLILIGTGCSLDKSLTIDPGSYTISRTRQGRGKPPVPFVEGMLVDTALEEVTIYLSKGDPLRVPYRPRPPESWPAGCPGNIYSQRMETFDLEMDQESAAVLGFSTPVLVRNCPETPYQLVFREDGEIGGAAAACPHPDDCLILVPSQNPVNPSSQDLELRLEELEIDCGDFQFQEGDQAQPGLLCQLGRSD